MILLLIRKLYQILFTTYTKIVVSVGEAWDLWTSGGHKLEQYI